MDDLSSAFLSLFSKPPETQSSGDDVGAFFVYLLILIVFFVGAYFQTKRNNQASKEQQMRIKAGEKIQNQKIDKRIKIFLWGIVILLIVSFLYFLIIWALK